MTKEQTCCTIWTLYTWGMRRRVFITYRQDPHNADKQGGLRRRLRVCPRVRQDVLRTFMAFDGTSVKSAIRVEKRISFHMGSTRPFHVYFGMYSGMCVWYDTTRGMDSSFAYSITANTMHPAANELPDIKGGAPERSSASGGADLLLRSFSAYFLVKKIATPCEMQICVVIGTWGKRADTVLRN